MTPTETLSHLRALTDPTPDQLREASDLALLATDWYVAEETNTFPRLWMHDASDLALRDEERPHPCADLQDAVRWMVPEGWGWKLETDHRGAHVFFLPYGAFPDGSAETPALALTIAGLAARLEDKDAR